MSEDFYCDEVLSGKTSVNKVYETENVLGLSSYTPNFFVYINFERHRWPIFRTLWLQEYGAEELLSPTEFERLPSLLWLILELEFYLLDH